MKKETGAYFQMNHFNYVENMKSSQNNNLCMWVSAVRELCDNSVCRRYCAQKRSCNDRATDPLTMVKGNI